MVLSFIESIFGGIARKTKKEAIRLADEIVEDPHVGRVDALQGNLQGGLVAERKKLPCPMPIPNIGKGSWNVIHKRKKIEAKLSLDEEDSSFKVEFVPGKHGSISGIGFHASPTHAFPTLHARFSYKIYFPEDFDWVRGGKLPGLFIGNPGATGGHWDYKAGSARVTWQKDGFACVYLYIPLQVAFDGSKDEAINIQSEEFRKLCHRTPHKGCHLWHTGPLRFEKGQWNDVTLDLKMNSVGRKNGHLKLTVNGKSVECHAMVWRKTPHLAIGGVSVQTFYGGSVPEAAAPMNGSFAKFKDFMV